MATINEQRESLAYYIWDAYKDAHGIRPRFMGLWDADGVAPEWTLERLQEEADRVEADVMASIEADQVRERIAIDKFEAAVLATIAIGAGDRDTAIRWLMEAEDCSIEGGNNDVGFFEYLSGLPYGYVKGEQWSLGNLI